MSTITWDRINNDVENIINEFNNFLDNNQYNEANEIIEDIMSAFDGNFGIELNNAIIRFMKFIQKLRMH